MLRNTFNLCLRQEDILLPHKLFIESLHLHCTNLRKFPGTGSMSIAIGCILEPSSFQPHCAPLKMSIQHA